MRRAALIRIVLQREAHHLGFIRVVALVEPERAMAETDLSTEIAAFLRERARLTHEYGPSWVVFVGADFKGAFEDFAKAVAFATTTFPNAPFLIRHTMAPEPQFPFLVAEKF
jgi:hypothetical protein